VLKRVLSHTNARRLTVRLGAFRRDMMGATAVEFAFIGLAFVTLLLGIIQFALVFMAQMYLHDALSEAATGRTAGTYAGNRTQVVAQICARLIAIDNCATNLLVENQPLANYPEAAQPISGVVFAVPAVRTPMLIRARAPVVTFVPGLPTLRVSATALYARLQ
jgi:Flp pilus assembly protein TadG